MTSRRGPRCWLCNLPAPIERVTTYPRGVLFRDKPCVSVHHLCVYHFHEHRGDLRAAKRHGEPLEGVRHHYTWTTTLVNGEVPA